MANLSSTDYDLSFAPHGGPTGGPAIEYSYPEGAGEPGKEQGPGGSPEVASPAAVRTALTNLAASVKKTAAAMAHALDIVSAATADSVTSPGGRTMESCREVCRLHFLLLLHLFPFSDTLNILLIPGTLRPLSSPWLFPRGRRAAGRQRRPLPSAWSGGYGGAVAVLQEEVAHLV